MVDTRIGYNRGNNASVCVWGPSNSQYHLQSLVCELFRRLECLSVPIISYYNYYYRTMLPDNKKEEKKELTEEDPLTWRLILPSYNRFQIKE